jgi:hypothetical protein
LLYLYNNTYSVTYTCVILPKYLLKSKMRNSIMNNLFKVTCLLVLSFFVSCGSDDGGPTTTGGGGDDGGLPVPTATYDLEFTTNFTEENNPQDYPAGATFGTIVAIVHAPEVSVFSIGQAASDGMALYAESGDVEGLAAFISTSLGEDGDGQFSISTAGVIGAQGSTTTSVTVTPTRTRITFLARLNPSPDWFVGVSSFNVVDATGVGLIQMDQVELQPLDAGVILGSTYEANDGAENAGITLYEGAPFGDGSPLSEAIGSLTLERTN